DPGEQDLKLGYAYLPVATCCPPRETQLAQIYGHAVRGDGRDSGTVRVDTQSRSAQKTPGRPAPRTGTRNQGISRRLLLPDRRAPGSEPGRGRNDHRPASDLR